VFVPVGTRQDTRAGLALYAGCRRHVLLAQRAACHAVSAVGSRALPGPRLAWRPPMPAERWADLLATWRRDVGEFTRFALVLRRQHSRPGFALLLLRSGTAVAFVKVREAAGPLRREQQALDLLGQRRAPGMHVPVPLAIGISGPWTWLGLSAMASRPHQPEQDAPVEQVVAQLQERLRPMPRPPGTPAHWTPMHGDLTPWNLRWAAGQRWLLDWEDVGYGPPGADALYYRATCASVGVKAPPITTSDEVVAFWHSTLGNRGGTTADRKLSSILIRLMRENLH